jgi:L-fuculose-phosphate aldolase
MGGSRLALAREICEAGRRLLEAGLVAGTEGNISARLSAERVLVTPAGRAKGSLEPLDIVEVDLAGRVARGMERPTSELAMHLAILVARPDIGAVVHAHPPAATGFAAAGRTLPPDVLPELITEVGPVGLVPYGMPGTDELAEAIAPIARNHDALLLSNHGAVTLGRSLSEALNRMGSLEQAARIVLAARSLGGERRLAALDVERLRALRRSRGMDE